ncbi:MAG: ankyrin repeat domain-containing protein [Wolbachia endosymbiont of Xenopsylla cheopis]
MVRILLKNGADINAQNDKKNTALHLAVSGQNLGMVQILLDNGANSSIENQRGNAPLHVAVNRSLDVKIHTKDIGKSNLSVATVTKQQISDQSNEETTQVIPINIKNLAKIQLNGTFRGYSHNVKNARIIEDLLAHDTNKEPIKALINQSNRDWYYPIHLAVISENLDAAEVLLSDPRIDINAGTGIAEDTALMLATEKDDDDMVKLLLSHDNIDHNICNDYGNTAFELALMNRCSNEIIVTLWRDIEKRIKNKTLKDHSIKLVRGFGMKEELDRIKAEYGIDIKSMVEFIYIPGLEGYGDEELDVSEESEASEHETLENQETEPELEMSDIEVEAGPAAKRQRRG